jgi:hypothetical protein
MSAHFIKKVQYNEIIFPLVSHVFSLDMDEYKFLFYITDSDTPS